MENNGVTQFNSQSNYLNKQRKLEYAERDGKHHSEMYLKQKQ